MKILFITNSFYESTFPLIRQLKKSHKVDLFCVQNINLLNTPELDLSFMKNYKNGKYNGENIFTYFPQNIKSYFNKELDFITIFYIKNKIFSPYILNKIFREINNSSYDKIHFIGINPIFSILSKLINNKKIYFSIHEFTINRVNKSSSFIGINFKAKLKLYFENIVYKSEKNKLIFFSENEALKFKKKYNPSKNQFKVIPFGVFETYKYHPPINNVSKFINYYLFLGSPKPYKGAEILFNIAIEKNMENNLFIFAGKGVSNIKNKNYPNIEFIDKFLTGPEIKNLIQNSKAVILPYRSASQSGIPSTSFALDCPIISTKIDGLKSYIEEGYNGLFVNQGADELMKLLSRENISDILLNMKSNLKKKTYKSNKFNWKNISVLILDFYK